MADTGSDSLPLVLGAAGGTLLITGGAVLALSRRVARHQQTQ